MNAPFKHYLGGKGAEGTYQQIINEIPPHDHLIIPFAGNCAVTRYMRLPDFTHLCDRDPGVITAWWRYIKDNNLNQSTVDGLLIPVEKNGLSYIKQELRWYHDGDVNYCIYADPPYLRSTRRDKNTGYKFDFATPGDHKKLLTLLLSVKVPVLISTYPNELYKSMLAGWRVKKYYSTTRTGRRLELLYMNFENPNQVLHDYQYAGKNFRDRERIKKKVNRFKLKFDTMDSLERNAILQSLSSITNNVDGVRLCSITGNGDASSGEILSPKLVMADLADPKTTIINQF